ncbi:MAG: cell division protein FtsQ [Bergeyella sp.]|nr:cell division protein FtsQ [Bergeyella sp.]
MRNKYRILKILFTVMLLGVLLSFSLDRFSSKILTEKDIKVHFLENEGKKVYFLKEGKIREMVYSSNPDKKIGTLNVSAIEKKLESYPEVDSANVFLNLKGELFLEIAQKIPVFRLKHGNHEVYVDTHGKEFPLSKNYSCPCMLVSGKIPTTEYENLVHLVDKINRDAFYRSYFIGIIKKNKDYFLIASKNPYKIEFGDLENIDTKLRGFKTFVERYLAFQNPKKYKKISVKYRNQIVATQNPNFVK